MYSTLPKSLCYQDFRAVGFATYLCAREVIVLQILILRKVRSLNIANIYNVLATPFTLRNAKALRCIFSGARDTPLGFAPAIARVAM